MATEQKESGNPWIWATVIFGLVGVVTTGPLLNNPTVPEPPNKPVEADRSDDIYPTPRNIISKSWGPWEDPFEPVATKLKFEDESKVKQPDFFEVFKSQWQERDQDASARLIVLVKIVDGAFTDEGVQTRRRHRHAIELAMASADYTMMYKDRMSYANATYDFYHTSEKSSPVELDVPIKLYSKQVGPADSSATRNQMALVLWIRNEHLGERPLAAISQITQNVLPFEQNIYDKAALVVLGPSSSNQLALMVQEHKLGLPTRTEKSTTTQSEVPPDPNSKTPAFMSMPDFYSKWKYGALVMNSSCTASSKGVGLKECDRQIVLDKDSGKKLTIAHAVGEDSLLINGLAKELELRGRNTRIVLFVGEQSEKYMRELKDFFTKNANRNDENKPAAEVIVIPYLRGVAESAGGKPESGKNNQSVADYLARTFSQLSVDQAEEVSAVGVFGTQTMDKIAIFGAARSVFPTAAFFTTELDSRYSEAKNYNACRNLLVASHFGLTCKTDLFNGSNRIMPTFRDGYQTSAYLATLIALDRFENIAEPKTGPAVPDFNMAEPTNYLKGTGEDQQDLYNLWARSIGPACSSVHSLEPLVFEVARSGNFQFPTNDQHRHPVINAMDRQPLFSQYGFLPRVFIAFLLVLGIGLVTRAYSSELERALDNAGSMLLVVGKSFNRTAGIGGQFFARLTSARESSNVSQPLSIEGVGGDNRKQDSLRDSIGFVIWFVAVIASSLVLGIIAWISDISPEGEPVTWTDSISIWPSVLLFHGVTCISSYRILRFATVGRTENSPAKRQESREVTQKGLVLALLLGGLIVSVMGVSVRDVPPARGEVTRTVASVSLRTAAACLFILSSLSSLSIMRARKQISSNYECRLDALDLEKANVDVSTESIPAGEPGTASKAPKAETEDKSTKLAQRAENLLKTSAKFHEELLKAMETGKDSSLTLIAPAALTIVLAIARLPLLDSWGLPRVWYAALMTPMLLSVIAALLMRSEARSLKSTAVETLETEQSSLLKNYAELREINSKSSDLYRQRINDCVAKVEYNISLINRLNRGPFSSVYNDPLLGGLLLIITAGLTGPLREQTMSLLSLLHLT